ncbi:alpha/beta-hydrolase [Hypoxylon fragiforme]|uniref:alpha/beta-hydrolase n=1 Tax=Hypoxylon fragiforme TaxID=63214 RepID=UPI0020C65F9B|nr:alpha/beta-hydrolase [Hypoxylon fragiforme]KAI2612651.1 alpha/beta-hydrolase [Hypoxylon fragiforme]
MRTHILCAAIAISGALSLLITPTHRLPDNVDAFTVPVTRISDAHAQKPLRHSNPKLGATGRKFRVKEQTDDICRAGSRQWTGWIDISEEKSLFFWFFESRHEPSTDPVVVWLNGGPGGSSLMGLFSEIGPCLTNQDNNDTILNKHSWTNFASVLFIDQPAGVGFSKINNGTTGGPDNEVEVAQDLNIFLHSFFTEVFPGFAHQPFHIAGESFGGTYVPGFVDFVSRRAAMGVPGIISRPIQSIILIDAVIDIVGSGALGEYDHMCRFNKDGRNQLKLGLNRTACDEIEKSVQECERLNRQCIDTYDGHICKAAWSFCDVHIESLLQSGPVARNVYDDREPCHGELPFCGKVMYDTYLNLPKVQAALGVDWIFSAINRDLNTRWEASLGFYLPTTRELQYILDNTGTRVLALNGNNDIIVNTEGQKRVYDQQPWNHQARYRLEKFAEWTWPDESGNLTKGGEVKSADKLTFVSVDEAGHTSPGDQKQAVGWIMKCWLHQRTDATCVV